jgi:hypothetical protein
VEQFDGSLTWNADSGNQHTLGYRIITTGLPLPAGYVLGSAWIAPVLYGDRFTLLSDPKQAGTTGSPRRTVSKRGQRTSCIRWPVIATGTTATAGAIPSRWWMRWASPRRVVVVEVTPHPTFAEPTRVFTGQLYLEVGTGALLRMRGQIYSVRPPGSRSRDSRRSAMR